MDRIGILNLIDRLLGPPLVAFQALWLKCTQRLSARAPAPTRTHAPVLVIRPGGIGDAVVLLPLVRALRATLPREARLDILCEPRNRAIYDAAALPNTRIFSYTSNPFALPWRLCRARYGVVYDTEQSHWFSALFAAWTRAPKRIGFGTISSRACLYTRTVPYDLNAPERDLFARLLGLQPVVLPTRRNPTGPIVLHVGGSNPSKHWPETHYAELCDALAQRGDPKLILVGSAADRPACLRIAGLCHSAQPEVLAGKLSLAETTAVCARAKLFIGPDSSVAHLAESVGTYAIVLFGSGNSAKWGPSPRRGVALTAPVPCAPCARFGQLHRHAHCRYECMRDITPQTVLNALLKKLKKP